MKGKGPEVVETLDWQKLNAVGLQEIKYRGIDSLVTQSAT